MTEERMYELLDQRAKGIQEDIDGMRLEGQELDTGYECYVRTLDRRLVGYIYMGDCGEWAYEAGADGDLEMSNELDRIKRLTPYSNW